MDAYLSSKKTVRPQLGIQYLPLFNISSQKNFALIYGDNLATAVAPNGPAAKAKLKSGDIIQAINDKDIDVLSESIFSTLSRYKIGDKISLKYDRGGVTNLVQITLVSN